MTRMKSKSAPISVEDRRQIILGAWDIANEQASGKSIEFEAGFAEQGKEEKPENFTHLAPTHPCMGWGCWPDLAWKRNSRAVVAIPDDKSDGLILEYDGIHIDYECNENGIGRSTESMSPIPKESGLWIWEGRLVDDSFFCEEGVECGSHLDGTFRRLTMPELLRLSTGNRVLEPDPINPDTALELARALKREDHQTIDRLMAWLIGFGGVSEEDIKAMVESFDPTWEDDDGGGAS